MLKLMIIDDEDIIRNAIAQSIDYSALGYEVSATARNGMEAFDLICDNCPDVIITDIKMPVLDGLELIERVSKMDPGIKYIILSGYGEFEFAKKAMKFGVQHFLLKPTNRQELTRALEEIRQSHDEQQRQIQIQQEQILSKVRFPMQQCFLIEALEQQQPWTDIYQKYDRLLAFSGKCRHICICTPVEDSFLPFFLRDTVGILNKYRLVLQFPIICVNRSVVFIFSMESLATREKLKSIIGQLSYPRQQSSPDVMFQYYATPFELFSSLIKLTAQYSQIRCMDSSFKLYPIRNNFTAPWKVLELGLAIKNAQSTMQITELLQSIFDGSMPVEEAKNLAIELFLTIHESDTGTTTEYACNFFGKLYSCTTVEAISELLGLTLTEAGCRSCPQEAGTKDYIRLLKIYVTSHLDAENLSLKWIAENYLFISVGYLSKQFVKETGERFSDYLNRTRMEEAEKLMNLYNKDNIAYIAKNVGFGTNPHYFSQVFKRYTGCTPSEYYTKIKKT